MPERNYFADEALAIHKQGYGGVIPIPPGGKRPTIDRWSDWSSRDQSVSEIERLIARQSGPGTGLGLVAGNGWVGVDIDIMHEHGSSRALDIVERHCGRTPLVRVGEAPKRMGFFAGTEIKSTKNPYGLSVEIFGGARGAGGQVVAYGKHPNTGADYQWIRDWAPRDVPVDDLPVLTPDALNHAVAEMADDWLLKNVGRRSPRSIPCGVSIGRNGISLETVRDIVDQAGCAPIDALAEFVASACPATRHASAQAAVRLIVGWRMAIEHEDDALAQLRDAFDKAKPEASSDEFRRMCVWARSAVSRVPRITDTERKLGLAP